MPKKKPEPKQTPAEKVVKAVENAAISIVSCGHINRQHHNTENELEDLACTLEKGHAGDHSAEVDGRPVSWSNAAGTPVRQHK
jgi:hypothetical protein